PPIDRQCSSAQLALATEGLARYAPAKVIKVAIDRDSHHAAVSRAVRIDAGDGVRPCQIWDLDGGLRGDRSLARGRRRRRSRRRSSGRLEQLPDRAGG